MINPSSSCRAGALASAICLMLGPAVSLAEESGAGRAGAVSISLRALIEADWTARDARYSVASGGPSNSPATDARGVTTPQDAAGACDGVKNGRWGFHTASGEQNPWWQVDLGRDTALDRVVVFNRTDSGTAARTKDIRVLVSRDAAPGSFTEVYRHDGRTFGGAVEGKPLIVTLFEDGVTARVVRLQILGRCSFALDEVEVFAKADPVANLALGKPADQKSVGPHSYAAPASSGGAARASAGGGFTFEHTREVITAAAALAARLRAGAEPERLDPLLDRLGAMRKELDALAGAADAPLARRRALHLRARWLARAIAFTNPRLDFDRLLFIKRHHPGGPFHMCDQYYGCNAVPGGGLFVLEDPFGEEPRVRDLLADSVVEGGRLAGKRLDGGAFLSPELSFDGETVLFSSREAKAKKTYQWAPEFSFHIFGVGADGTGLRQLTDGSTNDFDPCFLPGGRVAFISERRGGYLRCGRHCPVYTLHSMEPDGSDIILLSYHETHEWQPSVTNDGMLVYTRWDYVDRDTNVAHHIWTCFPDGRDPRSQHGNYPERRETRPWMEMSIRAVPGSTKFVATAGAHHGHAFGSLVLIDHNLEDDRASSQLERLTPEVPFPEGEGGRGNIAKHMVYGTAWPLSEDDYLCAYAPDAKNHGIYWIDRFGNKELLYRDPSIPSMSPIPLRPRPRPPVLPDRTTQTAVAKKAADGSETATIAVMDVYDSDFDWPEGTRIEALRIIHLLPKTTPPPNEPRIGVAEQTNARTILGTVPVEADGSAYFEAPVGKPIYFQALDGRGMAVQSMRSVTYAHPGETLVCRGCHERKRGLRDERPSPTALRRPPSKILPEVDGSNPFSYVRLVQPALDRNCVGCHQREGALDLGGVVEGSHGWTRSYANLAPEYGFYFDVANGSLHRGVHGGSRTIAGAFGARASGLLGYLDEGHHGVRLSDEDRRRIVLWLDCNSEFYGAYENTAAQSRGEVVQPSLD